jgi:hypothetical protein
MAGLAEMYIVCARALLLALQLQSNITTTPIDASIPYCRSMPLTASLKEAPCVGSVSGGRVRSAQATQTLRVCDLKVVVELVLVDVG